MARRDDLDERNGNDAQTPEQPAGPASEPTQPEPTNPADNPNEQPQR